MHRFACRARAASSSPVFVRRRRVERGLARLLALGLSLTGAPALAQDTGVPATAPAPASTPAPAAPPASALAPTARDLADQGAAALQSGRYADAVRAYDAAYRSEPAPALLYNLGISYKALGYPGKAHQALESFVSYADPSRDASAIEMARNELERLNSGYARFTLKLTPADATLEIDGVRQTAENGELWVPAGRHVVAIRAQGYESYEQSLEVTGGRFDLEVQLRELTIPAPDRAAQLLDEGAALEASGDVAGALAKYQQAELVHSTPRGQGQRGLAEERMGLLPDAEQHLKAAQMARKDKWVRKNRNAIRKALARINKELVTLTINGSPAGAEVFVNQRSVGVLPIGSSVRALPGTVTVQAKKPGYAMFEQLLEAPRRAKRTVVVSMEQAPTPVPVPLPMPEPAPEPVAVAPAEPTPVKPIPIEPIPVEEPSKVASNDIESFADPREDLANEPEEDLPSATGFEAALNFGYHPTLGGYKVQGSDGTLMGQILLGARVVWPVSFGVAINGGFDFSTPGTKLVLAAHPGFYLRGHTQTEKDYNTIDVWAGVQVQPVALQAGVRETSDEEIDPATVDPSIVNRDDVVRLAATREVGADRVRTLQSLNVPIELGATWYFTPAFGMDLSLGLTFWIPQQDCIHDGQDARFCTTQDLETQTSFFVGGGFTFLP